jgi:hypothetical protein
LDHDHSLYDSKKIHQDIQQPFDDWARYTELPFRQVSEGEKTDFNLTFVSGDHSDGAPFDGLGGQVCIRILFPFFSSLNLHQSPIMVRKTLSSSTQPTQPVFFQKL